MGNFFSGFSGPLRGVVAATAQIVGGIVAGPAGAAAGSVIASAVAEEGTPVTRPVTGALPPPDLTGLTLREALDVMVKFNAGSLFVPEFEPIPLPSGAECQVVPQSERAGHLESLADGFLESVSPWNTTHDIICTPVPGAVGSGLRRGVAPTGFFSDLLMDPIAGMRVGSLFTPRQPTVDVRDRPVGVGGGVTWSSIKKRERKPSSFPRGTPSKRFFDAFTSRRCAPVRRCCG